MKLLSILMLGLVIAGSANAKEKTAAELCADAGGVWSKIAEKCRMPSDLDGKAIKVNTGTAKPRN